MAYEAWRITYQNSEQAARAAFEAVEELAAQLAAAEQRAERAEKEVIELKKEIERLIASDERTHKCLDYWAEKAREGR